MNRYRIFIQTGLLMLLCLFSAAASTRQDSLRGGNGPGRQWWDVQRYELSVMIDTASEVIYGSNRISFRVTAQPGDSMQLDLQDAMVLDSVIFEGVALDLVRDGNAWWIRYPFSRWTKGGEYAVRAFYHGRPKTAAMPPWDGGFIRTRDSSGHLWMAVACQGLGASCWWPCKDQQSDKPDSGMTIRIETNTALPVISNGRLTGYRQEGNRHIRTWQLKNPVNTYNVTFYLGDYIHWTDTLIGAEGLLTLDFYALRAHEDKARRQFAAVKPMLHCFEYWMGAYPFYDDGYKLVEAPYLGMEHQSAIAYGNEYKMGYKGTDRSGTGIGMAFDFIIVHESGHEWFGNSITAADVADGWIHEGFTTYAEALFAECLLGKEKAVRYTRGEWKNIRNDRAVTGAYGVADGGPGDRYDKGAALVHMIRMTLDDDQVFRNLFHALHDTFYHQVVTSAALESFINRFTGRDFRPFFDQYLRIAGIPRLKYFIKDKRLFYRLSGAVEGLVLPVSVTAGKKSLTLSATSAWQDIPWKEGYDLSFSGDFLMETE